MDAAAPVRTTWEGSRLQRLAAPLIHPGLPILLLVAGLITLATSPVDADHPAQPDVLAYGLSIVAFGALFWRLSRPLPALAVCMGATVAFTLIEYPENGLPLACLVALYSVAALTPPRRSTVAAAAVALVIVFLTWRSSSGLDAAGAGANLAMFGIAYAAGRYMQVRRAYVAALELRAEATAEARRREAEQAVAEERLRIARELHDVVAHAMSVVAVQSGVAAHVIDDDPAQARDMLATINGMSREALAEMRRLLGVLRAEGDEPPAVLAPSPGIGDLDGLLASLDGTGVAVDLEVDGTPTELAPGLDQAAYRVVQESLTNVVRHAGPAHVAVAIRYRPDGVDLEITDDGRGAAVADDPPGGGHGLRGMRERVELYGGTLAAGPRPGGGFEVRASLPYDAAVPTS